MDLSLLLSHRTSEVSLRGTYSLTEVEYAGPVLSGQVTYRPRHSAAIGASAPYRWLRADVDAPPTVEPLPCDVDGEVGAIATMENCTASGWQFPGLEP